MSNQLLELELSPRSMLETAIENSPDKCMPGRTIDNAEVVQVEKDKILLNASTTKSGEPRRQDLYELNPNDLSVTRITGLPVKKHEHINWRFLGDLTLVESCESGGNYRDYSISAVNNNTGQQESFNLEAHLRQGSRDPILSSGERSVHPMIKYKWHHGAYGFLLVDNTSFDHDAVIVHDLVPNGRSLDWSPTFDSFLRIDDNTFAGIFGYRRVGFYGYAANSPSSMVVVDDKGKRKQQIIYLNSIAHASSLDGFLSVLLQRRDCQSARFGEFTGISTVEARTYEFDGTRLRKINEQEAFNEKSHDHLVDFYLIAQDGDKHLLFAYENSIEIRDLEGKTIYHIEVGDKELDNPSYPGHVEISYHRLSDDYLFRIAQEGWTVDKELFYTETIDIASGKVISRTNYNTSDKRPDLRLIDGGVCLHLPDQDKMHLVTSKAS